MNLNSFTWNNGSYDNPVVLPEENIVTLLKAKTQLTETQFNVGGHVISESGASYNHRIHNLKIEYPELNVHSAGSNCQIHQDTDISSHNVYNPDEVPDAESATAQNTTILLTNSDIGRHGLNMTTAVNDADFEYSFRAAYIDPTNINFNPVAYIRAHSHRYVGKYNSSTGVMKLRQLDDQDGTKFTDGTSAVAYLTDPDYDVFMKLPSFYYNMIDKVTDGVDQTDTVYACFWPATNSLHTFAEPYKRDELKWQYWDGNQLIAVYKGYVVDNNGTKTLHSVSGVTPTRSTSWNQFTVYARNRGNGFRLVTYDAHKVMALLFYAFYGDLDCQAQCGSGTNTIVTVDGNTISTSKVTGLTNSLGMMDTVNFSQSTADAIAAGTQAPNSLTSLRWYDYSSEKENIGNGTSAFDASGNPDYANGNFRSINFWGLENWWGDVYEIMDDLYGRTSTYLKNYINSNSATLTVTIDGIDVLVDRNNMDEVLVDETGYLWYTILAQDKQTIVRVIRTLNQNGNIQKMYFGDHSDVMPSALGSGHYNDYFYGTGGSGCVGFRSHRSAGSGGGVACLDLVSAAGSAGSYVGSRLFFSGDIEIVDNLDD